MSSKRVFAIVLAIAAILAAAVSLTGARATRPSDNTAASAMDSWDYFLRHSGPVGIQYVQPIVALTGDSAAKAPESNNGASRMESWDRFLLQSGPVGIQYQRPLVALTSDSAAKAPASSEMDSWDYFLRHSAAAGPQYLRPVVSLTGALAAGYLEPIVRLTSDSTVEPSESVIEASQMDSWDYFLRHAEAAGPRYQRPVVALTGEFAPTYLTPVVALTDDISVKPPELEDK